MHHHHETRDELAEPEYLPGLGKAFLTRLYDPVTSVLGVRSTHAPLVEHADVRPGSRVLEIGCGTANVALAAKRRQATAGCTLSTPTRSCWPARAARPPGRLSRSNSAAASRSICRIRMPRSTG